MAKVASEFEKIIHADRSRKKNEALAAQIFSKNRRSSGPPGAAGPLTNRSGIKKRVASSNTPRASTGNIDGAWTHDLHDAQTGPRSRAPARASAGSGAGSLASRITVPGAIAPSFRAQRRAAQVAQALIKTELSPATARQTNAMSANLTAAGGNRGISIRGLAGPYVVMAQNFAPGTTAADIESAMTPVGGIVSSCRLLKTQPIVIAEVVFESKEGAERAISTFNNQTADGRVLHVYPRVGGLSSAAPAAAATAVSPAPPSGPKAMQTHASVVDGSMGFDDPMEMDTGEGGRARTGGLYSDNLMSKASTATASSRGGRRGRGFGRGGRSGNGR